MYARSPKDRQDVEKSINEFPNFMLNIQYTSQDFNIYFIALFSENTDAIPILLLHGWPGSNLEFLPILRLLKQKYSPSELPYHIVVPSLPGYGFSFPPPLDKDFRLEDCAQIFDELMVQLGFGDGFVVQGGDVRGKIDRAVLLGGLRDRVKAVHLNFCVMPDPGGFSETDYSQIEREGLQRYEWFHRLGSAYALEHATKPSTIGLILSSNPLAF